MDQTHEELKKLAWLMVRLATIEETLDAHALIIKSLDKRVRELEARQDVLEKRVKELELDKNNSIS